MREASVTCYDTIGETVACQLQPATLHELATPYDGDNTVTAIIVPQHSSNKRKDDTFTPAAGNHQTRWHVWIKQTLHAPHLHEGELLSHALMHAGAEAQVGKRLLVLLPPRPKAVRVELECPGDKK